LRVQQFDPDTDTGERTVRGILVGMAIVLAVPGDSADVAAQEPAKPGPSSEVKHERNPDNLPFDRYVITDALGRQITFYLSMTDRQPMPLPLVVFIQGSGCHSLFRRSGDRVSGGYQNVLGMVAQGRARVLAVEKPGVKYLDAPRRPGTAEDATDEFLREHTLSRWVQAISAAIRTARGLQGVDATRILVMGHSEGAIVAARVAARDAGITHVASLSGGGPTQLFDLVEVARAPRRPEESTAEREQRANQVLDEWARILADPESTTRSYQGHPYRRWSSFMQTSVLDALTHTDARVYLAHGTLDRTVPVAGVDVLRAELAARGRDVTAERIEGADHSLCKPGESQPEGMRSAFRRVLDWFLAPKAPPVSQGPK
jgi:pimeloyl-ACP methyl ester carboxylesterase